MSAFADGHPDRYITPQVPIIGLGVIILDGLLRREWVKEDELAGDLKIHPRIMRKSLRWFEQVGKRPLPYSYWATSCSFKLPACFCMKSVGFYCSWESPKSSFRVISAYEAET